MKKGFPFGRFWDKSNQRRVTTWFDRFGFLHILVIWSAIITVFGLSYFLFSGSESSLYSNIDKTNVTSMSDAVYFSFITATSTGFGDIVPKGGFKIVSIFEVVFGLMLLAFVTSKLVSIKQDVILSEIYDISFKEKLNRLRSSLLLFRQQLTRMIGYLDTDTLRKREVDDLYIHLHSLETTLEEILPLFHQKEDAAFTKSIDSVSAELMINSIIQTFEKLSEFLSLLDEHKLEWKRHITVRAIRHCIELDEELFRVLAHYDFDKARLKSLSSDSLKIINRLKSALPLEKDETRVLVITGEKQALKP